MHVPPGFLRLGEQSSVLEGLNGVQGLEDPPLLRSAPMLAPDLTGHEVDGL